MPNNNILGIFFRGNGQAAALFRSSRKDLITKAVTVYQRHFVLIRCIWHAVDSITKIKTKKGDISAVKNDSHLENVCKPCFDELGRWPLKQTCHLMCLLYYASNLFTSAWQSTRLKLLTMKQRHLLLLSSPTLDFETEIDWMRFIPLHCYHGLQAKTDTTVRIDRYSAWTLFFLVDFTGMKQWHGKTASIWVIPGDFSNGGVTSEK